MFVLKRLWDSVESRHQPCSGRKANHASAGRLGLPFAETPSPRPQKLLLSKTKLFLHAHRQVSPAAPTTGLTLRGLGAGLAPPQLPPEPPAPRGAPPWGLPSRRRSPQRLPPPQPAPCRPARSPAAPRDMAAAPTCEGRPAGGQQQQQEQQRRQQRGAGPGRHAADRPGSTGRPQQPGARHGARRPPPAPSPASRYRNTAGAAPGGWRDGPGAATGVLWNRGGSSRCVSIVLFHRARRRSPGCPS